MLSKSYLLVTTYWKLNPFFTLVQELATIGGMNLSFDVISEGLNILEGEDRLKIDLFKWGDEAKTWGSLRPKLALTEAEQLTELRIFLEVRDSIGLVS